MVNGKGIRSGISAHGISGAATPPPHAEITLTRTATQEAGKGHSKDAQAETEGAAAEEEITKTEGLVLETVKEESETSSH